MSHRTVPRRGGGTGVGSTTFLYFDRVNGTVVAFATNLAISDRDRLALARRIAEGVGR